MGRLHDKVLRDLGYRTVTVDPVQIDADYKTVAEALICERESFSLRSDPLAVAVVAVPIPQLLDVAFQLAGTPKLLVEKPFAQNEQDALLLGAYLKERGSDVGVGYVERFNPVVQEFRLRLYPCVRIEAARFMRHNARESANHELDLLVHDTDLASSLGLWHAQCSFDVRSGTGVNVRRIEVDAQLKHDGGVETLTANLMGHEQSPLHAMWHAFLTDGARVARPEDAVQALQTARWVTASAEEEAAA